MSFFNITRGLKSWKLFVSYSSVGAVGELFDISCLYGSTLFNTIQEPLFEAWSDLSPEITITEAISFLPYAVPLDLIQAQHYFIPNPAGGLSPTWDFRASQRFNGVSNALFVGATSASLPDPVNHTANVAWLDVGHVSGDIATEVFRVSTVGGQPPTSVGSSSSSWPQNLIPCFSVHAWNEHFGQIYLSILCVFFSFIPSYGVDVMLNQST